MLKRTHYTFNKYDREVDLICENERIRIYYDTASKELGVENRKSKFISRFVFQRLDNGHTITIDSENKFDQQLYRYINELADFNADQTYNLENYKDDWEFEGHDFSLKVIATMDDTDEFIQVKCGEYTLQFNFTDYPELSK